MRALAEAVGEPADDEVAEEPGGGGEEGLLAGAGEAGVRTFLVGFGHADAVVDDSEAVRVVLGVVPAVHLDRFGRWREGQPVLHEFGEQVGDIGDGVPAYPHRLHGRDQDPPVLLHLGDGGLDDFQAVGGCRRGPRRVLSGQDQQAFGVAPHTGGEVVELEELGEGVRVEFLPFQAGDEAELAAYEVLVAAAEIGERFGGVAAQAGLLGGQVEGGVFHLVQGRRDLGDLGRAAQQPFGVSGASGRNSTWSCGDCWIRATAAGSRCRATSWAASASAPSGRVREREAKAARPATRAAMSVPATR